MKRRIHLPAFACIVCACLRVISLNAAIAPEQAALEAKIELDVQEKVDKATTLARDEMRTQYLAALDRELAALQSAGKVAEALQIKKERDSVGAGTGVPVLDDQTVSAALKKLRAAYRTAVQRVDSDRLKRIQPFLDNYNRELAALNQKLIKEGRLEEAEGAKQAAQLFAIKLTSKPATIIKEGVVLPFQNGQIAYDNRTFVWQEIADSASGMSFFQNAGGGQVPRNVRVREPGVLYVAVDATKTVDFETLKKLGFVQVPTGFRYNDSGRTKMAVFGKIVDRSINLPAATAWTGFVVIGNIQ